jgi:hypothetical protein
VAATVFYLRLQQLNRYQRGEAALTIDEHTLLNNSLLKPQQIPWTDIDYFVTGLYRTNSIFIKLNDLSSLKKEKTSGLIYLLSFIDRNLSTKPASFWIDMDVIDIKEKELLSMLLQRLKK